jgi:hypothetical protein
VDDVVTQISLELLRLIHNWTLSNSRSGRKKLIQRREANYEECLKCLKHEPEALFCESNSLNNPQHAMIWVMIPLPRDSVALVGALIQPFSHSWEKVSLEAADQAKESPHQQHRMEQIPVAWDENRQ